MSWRTLLTKRQQGFVLQGWWSITQTLVTLTKTSFSFPLLLCRRLQSSVARQFIFIFCKFYLFFFLSTLRNHGEQKRHSMSGEKPMLLPSSRQGKKKDIGNHWPVILTSILGKVMEQIILDLITKHDFWKPLFWLHRELGLLYRTEFSPVKKQSITKAWEAVCLGLSGPKQIKRLENFSFSPLYSFIIPASGAHLSSWSLSDCSIALTFHYHP